MNPDNLLAIITLQRRYMNMLVAAHNASVAGDNDVANLLIPMANSLKKEIDKRYKKIPKKDIARVKKSDLNWLLGGVEAQDA